MAFFAMVVIGSVQPRQPPFDGVICKRKSLAEPLRIKLQHRNFVQPGPASVFVCWHYSGTKWGGWFGVEMLLPCINKRNRPKAESTGTARIRTNSTGSEHFGQKGKIRPFRSVISCAEECAWEKP